MRNLSVLKDSSEIVHYANPNIPLYIKDGKLSAFPNMEALCHWHEDIEYIKAIKGHMTYHVNGKEIVLKENDALIVNSKQMHYGYAKDQTDCHFICIVFKTQLLFSNPELINKYLTPVLKHSSTPFYYLDSNHLEEASIINLFDDIYNIYQQQTLGFELMILSNLILIWMNWFKLLEPHLISYDHPIDENIAVQKKMVEFIYDNYRSKLTLTDIATAGNVCRSKCCKIFKTYFNKTPISYLNTYRLEVSLELLGNPLLSITAIAFSCGFNSASYYSEMFLQYKGCTPSDFRLQQGPTDNL